jgi:hypothetical protein
VRGFVIVVLAGCASRAPVRPIANSAPGWSERCAELVESSVRVDADGIDHLVVPIDDTLRACWRAAFQVVNERRERVIPPSCRALRFAEPPPTEAWLASCRRYEAIVPPPHVAERPQRTSRLFGGFGGVILVDQDDPDLGRPRIRPLSPTTVEECGAQGCFLQPFDRESRMPPAPPYDLTPSAQHVCDAVTEVVSHFAIRPSPELPLVVEMRWDHLTWWIAWPPDSTITPVEDALASCLAKWTVTTVDTQGRAIRWSKGAFVVELMTSPERRLSISKH